MARKPSPIRQNAPASGGETWPWPAPEITLRSRSAYEDRRSSDHVGFDLSKGRVAPRCHSDARQHGRREVRLRVADTACMAGQRPDVRCTRPRDAGIVPAPVPGVLDDGVRREFRHQPPQRPGQHVELVVTAAQQECRQIGRQMGGLIHADRLSFHRVAGKVEA